ncbi:hypothetical protein EDC01DRAFT_635288 [Geopyxis carbonaria]|nr:hypothetical protein EDC01DRAFT_635288 [Geopyxis carbonaria]
MQSTEVSYFVYGCTELSHLQDNSTNSKLNRLYFDAGTYAVPVNQGWDLPNTKRQVVHRKAGLKIKCVPEGSAGLSECSISLAVDKHRLISHLRAVNNPVARHRTNAMVAQELRTEAKPEKLAKETYETAYADYEKAEDDMTSCLKDAEDVFNRLKDARIDHKILLSRIARTCKQKMMEDDRMLPIYLGNRAPECGPIEIAWGNRDLAICKKLGTKRWSDVENCYREWDRRVLEEDHCHDFGHTFLRLMHHSKMQATKSTNELIVMKKRMTEELAEVRIDIRTMERFWDKVHGTKTLQKYDKIMADLFAS